MSITKTLSLIENLITGLVTGFFCCSTPMPPTPQLQPRRQKPVKQTIINALPPTAVAQQQQYQPQQQQHLHLPPPPPKTHQQHQQPQNVFICAPSWSQQQSSIQAMLQASSRQPPLLHFSYNTFLEKKAIAASDVITSGMYCSVE